MTKFFRQTLTALLIVAGLLTASVVGAAIQTFDGTGEWHTSDAETEQMAKARAQQRAQLDAQKKAGLYMQTFSRTANLELAEDAITAVTANIIEIVGDVHFDKKIIRLSNNQTTILYTATLKAKIDPESIYSFVKRDEKEKVTIVQQNTQLQDAIQKNDELAASLTEQYNRATTQAEKDRIRNQMKQADRDFLVNQKLDEGWKLFYANDYEGAIKIYNEALQLDPNNDKIYYELARLYWLREDQDYENELRNIVKAIQINPNNRGYHSFREDTYQAMVEEIDPKDALKIYTNALQFDPNPDQAYFGIARCCVRFKDFENTVKYFDKAIQLNPGLKEGYYYTHEIEPFLEESIEDIENLDDPKDAIKAYNKLLPSVPNFFAAEIHFKIGELYEDLEDYDNALKSFAKAIQLNPNNPDYYDRRASIFEVDLDDYEQAIAEYKKILNIKFDDAEKAKVKHRSAYHNIGRIYCKKLKDYKQAIEYYTKALEIKFDDAKKTSKNTAGRITTLEMFIARI